MLSYRRNIYQSIYLCTYMHIYMSLYTCMHACMHTHTHISIYVLIYACTYRLVVATMRVLFKAPRLSIGLSRVFRLNRLREECARRFAEAVSDRVTVLEILTDTVTVWDSFERETLVAAQESTGERPRTRQNLISPETLEAADAYR